MSRWFLSLVLLGYSVIGTAAEAQPSNPAAPVFIEADRLELDQTAGTSHYQGNVLLKRGSLEIKAEQLTLYSKENRLQRAVAEGSPATMNQPAENGAQPLRAEAAFMEYLPLAERVNLRGDAHLWHEGNEFSGEQISYDLKRQLVRASGAEQGDGRVRVLLLPAEEQPATGEKP